MFDLNRLFNALLLRVGAPADFQRMLAWKLLRGSHEFPGPHGGTCVNEAAIVAAGYPYQPVYCVKDMPGSFSRPLAMLALCLNDMLDDELRQELLMPFVTRLSGTADASKNEMLRAELILRRTVVEIMAPALARSGFTFLAESARALRSPMELVEIARRLHATKCSARHQPLLAAFEHAADAVAQWRSALPAEVVFCAFSAMREIASLDHERHAQTIYRQTAAILRAALEIGKSTYCGPAVVARRMEHAERAPEAARHEDGSVEA